MEKAKEIWLKIIDLITEDVPQVSLDTWFKPVKPIEFKENTLTVACETDFIKNMLLQRYRSLIANSLNIICGEGVAINIILENQIDAFKTNNSLFENEFSNPFFKKTNTSNAIGILPKYTFENFVVGGGNRFAHAASLAVAEAPAQTYNPLFLYGCSGLGKTHLMHAIGNFINMTNPQLKVLYTSSETFTNDLVNSIKDNTNEEFRNKYRQVDVLLIDDIQFIGGKHSTEEEFFHTFNHLYQADKQIIISSDRHPKELTTLEERLRSRCDWGLVCDIQPPDYETRLAILQKKLQFINSDVPHEVLDFIANRVVTNVRELEGTLTRITAYSQLNKVPVSMDIAKTILKEYAEKKNRTYTFSQILTHVADYFDISPDDLISKRRNKELVYARNLAMYISRNLLDYPFTLIGDKIKRDHSTVMYGIDNIEKSLKTNSAVKDDYDNILKSIQDA